MNAPPPLLLGGASAMFAVPTANCSLPSVEMLEDVNGGSIAEFPEVQPVAAASRNRGRD